jgi:hypothetical protein
MRYVVPHSREAKALGVTISRISEAEHLPDGLYDVVGTMPTTHTCFARQCQAIRFGFGTTRRRP